MNLDVVIPTYNRSRLLRKTLRSLVDAKVPDGMVVTLIVVDNNCKDDTAEVVREIQSSTGYRIRCVKETRQGLSNARNRGIAAGVGEIVAFVDDDEEVDRSWYEVIHREFRSPETYFIGGPYLPNWEVPAPNWLPQGYHAVIGVIPPKPRAAFGQGFEGNLMGGNAVMRRTVFERVGLYSPKLGRSGKGLLSDEDEEFYSRLRLAGLHGMYVPDLIIYHFIPASRLTRSYHRSWCFWRGASKGIHDRDRREDVPYLLGVPRYRIGRALRGAISFPVHACIGRDLSRALAGELAVWDIFGFVFGKFFMRLQLYYQDATE